jgi:hypothetical protein
VHVDAVGADIGSGRVATRSMRTTTSEVRVARIMVRLGRQEKARSQGK